MNPVRRDDTVAHLSWDRIARRIENGAAAILPIGAGAKQHGFHLPMATDQILAEYLAHTLASRVNALIWPTVTYGFYPAFTAYAGSASLSAATFKAEVTELVDSLLGYGAGAVFVLNTGLSTITPVEEGIRQCREPETVHHLKVFSGPRFKRAAHTVGAQRFGSHADEIETSLMLTIAPDEVDVTRAQASPASMAGAKPGPLTPTDKSSPNYAPSGSYGDPTLASAEKGAVLVAAIIEDICHMASLAFARTGTTSKPR